jgi:hypothetical protein
VGRCEVVLLGYVDLLLGRDLFLFPEGVAESCKCEVASEQFHDKTAGVMVQTLV